MNELSIFKNGKEEQKMSSREIAEITEKRHDHVLRDIDKINDTYAENSLPKVGLSNYTSDRGKVYREYLLTFMQTMDLMTGYSTVLRIKVNRRWEELEKKNALSYPEALRMLADEVEAKEKLQIELDEHKSWYSVKRVQLMGHLKGKDPRKLWRPLKECSIARGYQIQSIFDANYGDVKTYHKDVWKEVYGLEI